MKTCNAVLFDFGGVIADEGFKQGLHVIAEKNGLDLARFEKTASDLVHSTGFVTGKCDENAYFAALKDAANISENGQKIKAIMMDRFRIRRWMIEIIKKLRANNIMIAIVSDQTNWLDELNERYDFFKFFDHIFNSFHLGKTKRDPSIFDDVLGVLGITPDRALFIDDAQENIERAASRGLNTILYTGKDDFLRQIKSYYPFLIHEG